MDDGFVDLEGAAGVEALREHLQKHPPAPRRLTADMQACLADLLDISAPLGDPYQGGLRRLGDSRDRAGWVVPKPQVLGGWGRAYADATVNALWGEGLLEQQRRGKAATRFVLTPAGEVAARQLKERSDG